MQHTVRVFSDDTISGIRRKLGFVAGYNGYFSHIPPAKRKRPSAYHCPVGGEETRDYWYCHDTGSRGDVKLCVEHEVLEVPDRP